MKQQTITAAAAADSPQLWERVRRGEILVKAHNKLFNIHANITGFLHEYGDSPRGLMFSATNGKRMERFLCNPTSRFCIVDVMATEQE
jgi:hypothetical protein